MSVIIGHASHDERGKYSGGQAGDQTGTEVAKTNYYNRPFLVVIRAKNLSVADAIAAAMEAACANNNIGYDQNQRTTLYTEAKKVKFDLSKVATKCETDCSALVAVCVNAAGIGVSKDIYTGNEEASLLATGQFDTIYKSTTTTAPESILERGDILLYPYHHTAIVLTDHETKREGFIKEGGKWYYYENGVKATKKWIKYHGYWFRMGTDGAMLTGWHQVYDEQNILRWCFFEDGTKYPDLLGAEWKSDDVGYQAPWKVE